MVELASEWRRRSSPPAGGSARSGRTRRRGPRWTANTPTRCRPFGVARPASAAQEPRSVRPAGRHARSVPAVTTRCGRGFRPAWRASSWVSSAMTTGAVAQPSRRTASSRCRPANNFRSVVTTSGCNSPSLPMLSIRSATWAGATGRRRWPTSIWSTADRIVVFIPFLIARLSLRCQRRVAHPVVTPSVGVKPLPAAACYEFCNSLVANELQPTKNTERTSSPVLPGTD